MSLADEIPETQLAAWRAEQADVATRVIAHDDFSWSISDEPLYIAGVDVSFSTKSAQDAVVTAVMVELNNGSTRVVFSTSRRVTPRIPYAAGYLAFRELPLAMQVLNALPSHPRPHALIVDGNGVLHHRAAGLACHLGLATGLPTIGVGKNLLCVDGLDDAVVRAKVAAEGTVPLVGTSGKVWGTAMLTGNAQTKPIFVSVGNQFGIESATELVRKLCLFRVPEPVRIADIHSREALRTGRLVCVWDESVFGKREA